MQTAIIYYSEHHGNTKKLLDAIKEADPSVVLIDVTKEAETAPDAKNADGPGNTKDLSGYDRIGIASGIYFSSFAKQALSYAEEHLPEEKPVFFVYTHGAPKGDFLKGIRDITEKKHCTELGEYRCQGYDTFGPFKLVGGIAKGHPTQEEIDSAVRFYQGLPL